MQLLLDLPIHPLSCSIGCTGGVHIDKILFEPRREDPSEIDEVFGSQCSVSGGLLIGPVFYKGIVETTKMTRYMTRRWFVGVL
jgi:hypothetical protein